MEIDYPLIALFLIIVAVLLIFLIRRNLKDKKKLEQDLNQSSLEPDSHKEDRI
jgi:preprotein translocase subunit YajC